ncbi:MAG: Sec-independent protein translocase protein TatB [Gammaproteobacteria bacterium]
MFEIGFTEILVITVLALVVLGPEKLPRVAAQVGRWMGRARAMARQFREQLEEEVHLAEANKAKASSASAADSTAASAGHTDGASSAGADQGNHPASATDPASPAADPGPPMYSDGAHHPAADPHHGGSSADGTTLPPEVAAANAAAETAHSDFNGPAPEPEAAEYHPPIYEQVRATHGQVGTHEAEAHAGTNGTSHGGANGGEPSNPRSSTVESLPHHEDPPAKAGDFITHTHERGI